MIVVNDRQGRKNPWAHGPIAVANYLLFPKNVEMWGNFTKNEYSAPMTIEKMKILGAVLELSTS